MVAGQGGDAGAGAGTAVGDDDKVVRSRIEGADRVVTLRASTISMTSGPGYQVTHSGRIVRTMAHGVVFRSAAISATDGDVGVIEPRRDHHRGPAHRG